MNTSVIRDYVIQFSGVVDNVYYAMGIYSDYKRRSNVFYIKGIQTNQPYILIWIYEYISKHKDLLNYQQLGIDNIVPMLVLEDTHDTILSYGISAFGNENILTTTRQCNLETLSYIDLTESFYREFSTFRYQFNDWLPSYLRLTLAIRDSENGIEIGVYGDNSLGNPTYDYPYFYAVCNMSVTDMIKLRNIIMSLLYYKNCSELDCYLPNNEFISSEVIEMLEEMKSCEALTNYTMSYY